MCRQEANSIDTSWFGRASQEFREQMKTSLPAMAGMLTTKIPWLLSIHFAGNIGAPELAAAALATTLCNVTGLSLSVGLSSALSTLTGQARGDLRAKKERKEERRKLLGSEDYASYNSMESLLDVSDFKPLLPLVFLYRGMFIQLIFVVPVGIWWLTGVESTLLHLGQGEELASMTSTYLRILAPGLLAYSVNWTFTSWLQALEMADIPAFAATLALIFHIPFNMLFIHGFGWGYLGVGVATVMTQAIQPVYILSHLFLTSKGSKRLLDNMAASGIGRTRMSFKKEAAIAINSLTGTLEYLSLALPGIVIISEWWASEVSIFLSGRLIPHPDLALDGMTIYQSINTFCFMFPVSYSIAGSARVGNFLGSGNITGADLSSKVSIGSAAILSIILGSILFFTPHTFFPSFFSPDEAVVQETARLIPLLSVYVVGDGIQSALNGVIKGCGRQCIIMPIVLVAYWAVGVPLAYYLAFIKNDGVMCEDKVLTCGVTGLVTGMTLGTWIHMLLLALVVGCTTNWSREAEKAKERLSKDSSETPKSLA